MVRSTRIEHKVGSRPTRQTSSSRGIGEIIGDKREAILVLAAKHGVLNVRVFGSVAEGDAAKVTNADFLVDIEPGRSLLDLGGLLMDTQYLLGRRVDVVTEVSPRDPIRQKVQRQAVKL